MDFTIYQSILHPKCLNLRRIVVQPKGAIVATRCFLRLMTQSYEGCARIHKAEACPMHLDFVKEFGVSPRQSQRSRKSDFVYFGLKERIIIGDLKPGQTIGEQQIAVDYGCAQGTVREALIRLDNNGLVIRNDYRGTQVSPLCRNEALQMVLIRKQLEKAAARRVASKLPDEVYRNLKLIMNAMYCTAQDGRIYLCSEFDRRFHGLLFAQSGLAGLEPILNRCAIHMHRFTLNGRTEKVNADDVFQRHSHILECYRTGTPDEAAEAISEHIDFLIKTWILDGTEEAI